MRDVRVTGLRIHPLKSGAIRLLDHASVEPSGLRHDRRWMVVDADGECVTARTDRALFTLDVEPLGDGALRLAGRQGGTVTASPVGGRRQVTVHGRAAGGGIPLSEDAQALVRRTLGRDDVTIVWCADPGERRLNPGFSRPGDHTAYADGYPVTLASLASLRQLSAWAGQAVPVDRFRPNVVVDGDLGPFAEDDWAGVTIGEVPFRVAKGVDRCSMTLIDPATLATGPEPIRTLSRHRKRDGKTWFCVHLIPDGTGSITVGDAVSIA